MENEAEENQSKEEYIIVTDERIIATGYTGIESAEIDATNLAKEDAGLVFDIYKKVLSVKASVTLEKKHH